MSIRCKLLGHKPNEETDSGYEYGLLTRKDDSVLVDTSWLMTTPPFMLDEFRKDTIK